ncbi:hypothetical protein RB653_005426 [Dictyostelium firmibasis]|uniref:Uncharacterized protein n=1 Tax=Dictyostelium firmibasis TaxID=79012 RepID=A0AAN7U199_9MYCE
MSSYLYQVFNNKHLLKRYKFVNDFPIFEYLLKGDKFIAQLQLSKGFYIASGIFKEKKCAKEDCTLKAVEYIKKLEESIRIRTARVKIIQKYIVVLLVCLFFSSPFFVIKNDIGICTGNRVIVRKTDMYNNIFLKNVYYTNKGDYFIIRSNVHYHINNQFYFEAVISEEIVLDSVIFNEKYPTYTLPIGIGIGITFSIQKDSYFIDLISYEADGKPKRYVKHDIPQSSFAVSNEDKYRVFSKNGCHVVKKRFVSKVPKMHAYDWYFTVLSINIGYIKSLLLAFKSNDEINSTMGFDNFKRVTK